MTKKNGVTGFYTQLPKPSLGATIVADGDLCAEDVADYIIINKSKQHPNFSSSYPLEIMECEQYEVDPDTVGQYIGVSDKNGKEIYEKDIVRINGKREPFVVMWVCDTARFGLQSKEELLYFEFGISSRIEVIGNVYENADLLKEVENK